MDLLLHRELLVRSLKALTLCVFLVIFCYFFIDKPVAYYVYNHHLNHFIPFKWMIYLANWLLLLAPLVVVSVLIKLVFCPMTRLDKTLITTALALGIMIILKDELKFVFGRYWPLTWINNNPSLITDHAYGFNPFHIGQAYQSFPSGHTAVITTAMTIFWITYPRWRWAYIGAISMVVIGLLGMDYHFVSDVIAGGFIGLITGFYAVYFSGL